MEIEQNIHENLAKIQEFKSRYDFLMKHDQKLRSKINYIRYMSDIKPINSELLEIPLELDNSITKNESLLIKSKSKLSFFGTNDFIFTSQNNKNVAIKKITFESLKHNPSCLIQSFKISFYQGKHDLGYITNLNCSSQNREYEFPSHISFDTMKIEPVQYSNEETMLCIPLFHAYGESSFNE